MRTAMSRLSLAFFPLRKGEPAGKGLPQWVEEHELKGRADVASPRFHRKRGLFAWR